jgi:hypothetical protein
MNYLIEKTWQLGYECLTPSELCSSGYAWFPYNIYVKVNLGTAFYNICNFELQFLSFKNAVFSMVGEMPTLPINDLRKLLIDYVLVKFSELAVCLNYNIDGTKPTQLNIIERIFQPKVFLGYNEPKICDIFNNEPKLAVQLIRSDNNAGAAQIIKDYGLWVVRSKSCIGVVSNHAESPFVLMSPFFVNDIKLIAN